ncbi:hypothetical protein N658DRAFT_415870 [Parathielavia hyrcaniae]|uniref:PXA domain-containing protein n=1 Tax=Parathielavia hyrcaniae TaxID=113614 RepID=A0AAN6QD18_9PEZI|nr:hypothetical protein N658DRAFT_415870 [Parathielavia hyrcaniae]
MTTAAAQPPPPARIPTPRPKQSATPSVQFESTAAPKSRSSHSSAQTETSTPSQAPGGPRRGSRTTSTPTITTTTTTTTATDPLSDKTTAFLARRILCPQQADKGKGSPTSIEGLLPPLTSRNDVDLQLYALIAIVLRDFVQTWYAKITPDETFVAEVVQIIAHITRALEQRLRKIDLESLLFDELPDLLDKHVTAYRVAHDPITQPPVTADPRGVYHSLCPLPALDPVPRPEDPESVAVQAENEAAYRQLLVHSFLAILLPTEDLENSCLTALVGQILSELILGNALASRLSEPWFIWEFLIIATRMARRRKSVDGEHGLGQSSNGPQHDRRRSSAHALFWTIMHWCFLAVSFIRATFAVLMASVSLPPRSFHGASIKDEAQQPPGQVPAFRFRPSNADPQPLKTPMLAFRCWSAVSNLAELNLRMPWLHGALSMLQWMAIMGPGRIAGFDGKLDR